MKTRPYFLLLIALLALASSFMAVADVPVAIPEGTQQQVNELTSINYSEDFGQKVINWIAHGSDTPTFGDKSLLSVISLTLNAIALAMMAWLAVIGGATYIAQTANKGVPGGQVISSFWAPIRISTATILLIPLASGFSTLQYGVITVAEKGNAHGTYLMGVGLNYLYDFGAYRAPGIPDGRSVLFSLVESEVCKQYINSYTKKETITPVFTEGRQGSRLVSKVAYRYNEAPTWSYANDPRNDYCGAVSFTIEHSDDPVKKEVWGDDLTASYGGPPAIAKGQMELLKKMQSLAVPIAASLLSDEAALRSLQANGAGSQGSYEKAVAALNGEISSAASEVDKAINIYNSESQKIIAGVVNKLNDDKNSAKGNTGWREQTMAMGWPALGTIFWQVNINQSEINKLAASFESSNTEPSVDGEWLQDARFVEISTRINGLKKKFAEINKSKPENKNQKMGQPDSIPSLTAIADAGAEGDGWVDSLKAAIYNFFAGSIKAAMFKNGPDDLIINMQYFGSAMSTLAETSWWAKSITINTSRAVLEKGSEAIDSVGNTISKVPVVGWLAKLGTTAASSIAQGISFQLSDVSSMLNYLILALVVVGFTLGVVLPTIPLSMWLMGVLSWMLFFIECLLVSPMWMAAHGTAEKDGWGSEHTRQGYMLMIGLYLNPILRVAGFFAIFAAMKPVGWLVSWFFDYVQGVVVSGFVMMFLFLGSVIISAIFAYSAFVRIFGLPSELFERGLRWVNGGQEVTGDSQGEKEARNNIAAFSSKSESSASHVARKGLPANGATPTPTGDSMPGLPSPSR